MNALPSKPTRALIRIAYFLPLLIAVLLLVFAILPHLFYFYEGDPKQSKGLFELMSDAWDFSFKQLDGTIESTPDTMYFPYLMIFSVALSYVCVFLYALAAIPSAICSLIAFTFPPTSKTSNKAKRWLHLFCPNRTTFAIFQLLPIFPACFPLILERCQRTMFALDLHIYYDLNLPDWVIVSIAVCIPLILWLALLPAQDREHMDMFRLYKSKT